MTRHRRHRTHLPERFLLAEPEDNLIAAVIRQAWCDAFAGRVKDFYAEKHRDDDKRNARRMFEADETDEWRLSLRDLAQAIQIDDKSLVIGYSRYKARVLAGKKKVRAGVAFDLLLKTLANGGRLK